MPENEIKLNKEYKSLSNKPGKRQAIHEATPCEEPYAAQM